KNPLNGNDYCNNNRVVLRSIAIFLFTVACVPCILAKRYWDLRENAVSQTALHIVAMAPCLLLCPVSYTALSLL
ncbi:hypothetical protein, partial [Escherichia coli]|uniref:hypothetical protein n=1 Tax=Escherichia coli TaxID=562 RepID=UPI0030C71DAF